MALSFHTIISVIFASPFPQTQEKYNAGNLRLTTTLLCASLLFCLFLLFLLILALLVDA